MSFFSRLKSGLSKTATGITDAFRSLAGLPNGRVPEDTLQDLEDALILADVGIQTATETIETLRNQRFEDTATTEDVKTWLADYLAQKLTAKVFELPAAKPAVILMVGVNGSGKTTTIGKLANQFKNQGKSVMLAAGDTFRAGAIEQLQIWADRAKTPLIKPHKQGADPAGLVFQAYDEAIASSSDILLIDTAGRLQNRQDLMAELHKISTVLKKKSPELPHEVLLVLDGTVGQNALQQVKEFKDTANVTGLIVTKLDGSSKAGVLIALSQSFNLPIYYIGVGESLEDLQPFNPQDFTKALIN